MPEAGPGFRKKDDKGNITPDEDAIKRWVENAYAHRNSDSPFIFENGREKITGKSDTGDCKCPST